ncbi:GlsB/YeaQ/YmgE family stress response membrane protein [Microbacterium sp. Root180]|uniref:GlsB/YeaQ/YmgE family stress response membrane protein n=1 Tax=Microbacterium sp. Root180 TaxID=1736483 RepID=UPI0007023BB1|nr:GlsB/YeaQ/YmgE family stress response membrane protein [Microbacterium sp. Root180]KRB38416.1 transglycosylase [Microbacterium sp. Root180]
MLWTILGLILIGLIAGLIARAVIPGKQSMGILLTIVLGIVGSFVGGFLGYLLFGADPNGGFLQAAGIIGSILGAIIVLGIYVMVTRRRSVTRS